jgi:hypothetical protein
MILQKTVKYKTIKVTTDGVLSVNATAILFDNRGVKSIMIDDYELPAGSALSYAVPDQSINQQDYTITFDIAETNKILFVSAEYTTNLNPLIFT